MKTGWDLPLTDWIPEIKEYSNAEVRRLTNEALKRIQMRTPVRTGKLQAGWYIQEMVDEGILSTWISNDVEYVIFVEYGTEYMAGAHMVEQTLNDLLGSN